MIKTTIKDIVLPIFGPNFSQRILRQIRSKICHWSLENCIKNFSLYQLKNYKQLKLWIERSQSLTLDYQIK